MAGICTLEDLLEEIVGEIEDEFDVAEEQIEQIDDDTYRIDGMFPIDEFNERFGTELPDEDFHTRRRLRLRPARPGARAGRRRRRTNGMRFDVLEVDGNRIEKIGASNFRRAARRRGAADGDVDTRPKTSSSSYSGCGLRVYDQSSRRSTMKRITHACDASSTAASPSLAANAACGDAEAHRFGLRSRSTSR